MPLFDDDNEPQNFQYEDAARGARGRGGPADDSWDREELDDADLVPDEMEMVRCGRCKKLILEETYRCPYCKHLQVEESRSRTSRWVFVTAIVCLAGVGLYFLLAIVDMLSWFHR